MINVVNITEFRNNFGTYIDRIIYKNEAFILTKGGKIVAKVTATTEEKKGKHSLLSLAGLWKDVDTREYEKALRSIDKADKADTLSL